MNPSPLSNLPFPIGKPPAAVSKGTAAWGSSRFTLHAPRSTLHAPRPQSGVALVITLILLSVITFMAVAFLVLSRADKGSVNTTTDQTTARFVADIGMNQAIAEGIASIVTSTNEFNYDLWVSTNYISPAGFINSGGPLVYGNLTNVSYNYPNGAPVAGNDFLQMLANLYYKPRPPVFITTNRNQITPPEFRFYLDLNRNGRFDTNGWLPVIGPNGQQLSIIVTNSVVYLTNSFVGDPEWIGVLERPEFPHSATNKFIARMAYIVLPAGKTLDINYSHNHARLPDQSTMTSGDGFVRNQGAGTWEINLAPFLVDLNTNMWLISSPLGLGSAYFYSTDLTQPNRGAAFDDALSVLRYRYYGPGTRPFLWSVDALFGSPGTYAFCNDFIDGYTDGPLMIGTQLPTVLDPDLAPKPRTAGPWSGSDNANHFFTTQELFDRNKLNLGLRSPAPVTLADRLLSAGTNIDSYNRYTFYRLLSQLGTDSAYEANKINLNYDNLVQSNRFTGSRSATNFLAWRPIDFFTITANRLLANAGYNFGVANIQIYPTNFYTPSVHQLLQLAANIYDAATNRTVPPIVGTNAVGLPTVFRPRFLVTTTNIMINGYLEVTNADIANSATGPLIRDLSIPYDRANLKPFDMVYGVPLVIGAKKGLPNFNELAMQTQVEVARKLEFLRKSLQETLPSVTNQMFTVSISNTVGVEGWNSYGNAFPRDLRMLVTAIVRATLTNEFGQTLLPLGAPIPYGFAISNSAAVDLPAGTWPGFKDANSAVISFKVPVNTNFMALPRATYRQTPRGAPRLVPLTGMFESPSGFPIPHWWLNLNTRLLFALVDTRASRIVDYVNLSSWENTLDITDTLMRGGQCGDPYNQDGSDGSMWCTNRWPRSSADNIPTYGILNQIGVGLGLIEPQNWNSFLMETPPGQDRVQARDFFRVQFGLSPIVPGTYYRSNTFYAPFTPFRDIYVFTSWQANDPLVHYTVGDLMDLVRSNNVAFNTFGTTISNLGRINDRYAPWGGNPSGSSSSKTKYQWALKDPLVTRSDDWDFPTNKFPNIGWLGRVHRGTPWQTVYLKAPLIDLPTWMLWAGDGQIVTNVGQFATNVVPLFAVTNDAAFTHPLNDRYILDLFTTAFNENASRGQLSINQTNLAAWSAVLSDVIVLTNTASGADLTSNPYLVPTNAPWVIDPAGVYDPYNKTNAPPIVRIVNAINDVRATNFTRKVFSRLGDILAVPELTVASPLLNTNSAMVIQRGINDEAYERLPQQILGLLKADPVPRFVIYSYGQTLKPAPHSLITSSGPFERMCTNYQVTAEVATRAVVRIEGVQYTNGVPYNPHPHAVIESFNVLPPE